MSCYPDCVEFMEKCYEEQEKQSVPEEEKEKKKNKESGAEYYNFLFRGLVSIDKKMQESTTVCEVRDHMSNLFTVLTNILDKDERIVRTVKKIMEMTEYYSDDIIEDMKTIFSDKDVFKVCLMFSKQFPIEEKSEVLSRTLEQGIDMKCFLLATKSDRAINLIIEIIRLCVNLCEDSNPEPDMSKYKTILASCHIHIIPLTINLNLIQIFQPEVECVRSTRLERRRLYEKCVDELEAYHGLLESIEEGEKIGEGDYLLLSNQLMEYYKEQKSFLKCFDNDCVGNIVGWEYENIRINFKD